MSRSMIAISYRDASNRAEALPKTVSQGRCWKAAMYHAAGSSRERLFGICTSSNVCHKLSPCSGPRPAACTNFIPWFKYETPFESKAVKSQPKMLPWPFKANQCRSETGLYALFYKNRCQSEKKKYQFVFKYYSVRRECRVSQRRHRTDIFKDGVLLSGKTAQWKMDVLLRVACAWAWRRAWRWFLLLSGWSCISENDTDSRAFPRSPDRPPDNLTIPHKLFAASVSHPGLRAWPEVIFFLMEGTHRHEREDVRWFEW